MTATDHGQIQIQTWRTPLFSLLNGLVLVVGLGLAGLVHAQVIIEEQDSTAGGGSAWSDYFFGNVGGFTARTGSTNRLYASVQVGLDIPLERGSVFMEALLVNRAISLDQKLESSTPRDDEDDEEVEGTRNIEVDDSYVDLGDFYVRYSLAPSLEVVAGRQRVVWGQLDSVSPVNLMLPLQFQNRELILGKASQRVPQDHLSLFWYPNERWEVQLSYFPATRMDDILEEALDEVADEGVTALQFTVTTADAPDAPDNLRIRRLESEMPADLEASEMMRRGQTFHLERRGAVNRRAENTRSDLASSPDLEDHDQTALRILYRPSWGTVGLTYKSGSYSLFFNDFARLTDRRYSYNTSGSTPEIIEVYDTEIRPDLGDSDAFGLEIAVPRNRWTYKFEMVVQDAWHDLPGSAEEFRYRQVGSSNDYQLLEDEHLEAQESQARAQYYNRVLTENDGELYAPLSQVMMAFGADAELDRWRLNLSLIMILSDFDQSLHEDLDELADDADLGNSLEDVLAAPAISVARYVGPGKDRYYGAVLGFFGGYAGVSFFYNRQVGDNFRWQLGVEYIEDSGAYLISDANSDGERWDLEEDAGGFHFGFVYDF